MSDQSSHRGVQYGDPAVKRDVARKLVNRSRQGQAPDTDSLSARSRAPSRARVLYRYAKPIIVIFGILHLCGWLTLPDVPDPRSTANLAQDHNWHPPVKLERQDELIPRHSPSLERAMK